MAAAGSAGLAIRVVVVMVPMLELLLLLNRLCYSQLQVPMPHAVYCRCPTTVLGLPLWCLPLVVLLHHADPLHQGHLHTHPAVGGQQLAAHTRGSVLVHRLWLVLLTTPAAVTAAAAAAVTVGPGVHAAEVLRLLIGMPAPCCC